LQYFCFWQRKLSAVFFTTDTRSWYTWCDVTKAEYGTRDDVTKAEYGTRDDVTFYIVYPSHKTYPCQFTPKSRPYKCLLAVLHIFISKFLYCTWNTLLVNLSFKPCMYHLDGSVSPGQSEGSAKKIRMDWPKQQQQRRQQQQ
jgi:hypothetical protein